MTTEISSFSPGGDEELSFIATTQGNCAPSLATLQITSEAGNTLTFICIPESTDSKIASFNLSSGSRNLNFIALSLECEFTPVLGFDCSPMTMTLPGVANFGDFDVSGTKTTSDSWSGSRGDEYEFESWTGSFNTTFHYIAQKNKFYDPDKGYTSPGFYSKNQSGVENYSDLYWWMEEPEEHVNEYSGDYNYDSVFTKSYRRQEATLEADTTWYPINYNSHFRYLSTGDFRSDSYGQINTGISVSEYLNTYDWRWWRFRSLEAVYPDARRDAILRDPNFYNGTQFVTITDPDTEEVKVLPIEFKMSPYDMEHQHPAYNPDIDINGIFSPIAKYAGVYGSESDVTYKGRPIDFGRIPIPCSFATDAIIKLDGVEPKTVLPTFVERFDYENDLLRELYQWGGEGEDNESRPALYNIPNMSAPWSPMFYTTNPEGTSYTKLSVTQSNSTWYGFVNPGPYMQSHSDSASETETLTSTPSFSGFRDYGQVGQDPEDSRLVNYQRSWKFCLQLGPIYKKVYSESIANSSYNSMSFEKEYLGFGWGVFLVCFGKRDLSSGWDFNFPIHDVQGPFSYTTHLSEYFEYSVEQENQYYPSGYDIASGWGVRVKDMDFDEETIVKALEDFSKTPDQLEFTKSQHTNTGSGILNYLHRFPVGDGNSVDYEVGTYNDNWVGLNPFDAPRFESEPHPYKNKKPPREFALQKLWVFDKRHTLLGNSNLSDLEELFEEHPYLNNLMVDNNLSNTLMDHIPYVELNWSHETESYIFSINDDHTDWIRDTELVTVRYAQSYSENDEKMATYPNRYKMPTGELSLDEIVTEEEETYLPLSFNWSSYPRYFDNYDNQDLTDEDSSELYRSPFYGHPTSVSGMGSVKLPNKGDIWAVEFSPSEYLCVSNVNPNHYSVWALSKMRFKNSQDPNPAYERRYKLIPTYFDYD